MTKPDNMQVSSEPKIYKVSNAEDAAILHTKCTQVVPEDNIKEAKKQMLAIYGKRQDTCLGIAAPQVGVTKCFFLGKFGLNSKSVFPRKELNKLKYKNCVFMINPVILETSDKLNVHTEGCLSIDDEVYLVPRPTRVVVSYQNTDFKDVTAVLWGWDAYVFMHEYDHLIGLTLEKLTDASKIKVEKKTEDNKIDLPSPQENNDRN